MSERLVYNSPLVLILLLIFFLLPNFEVLSQTNYVSTSVTNSNVNQINSLLKQNGILNGYVALDNRGRVELKGSYDNERQVDQAFSLAQTIVGVNLVSPVTPEHIEVKEWERCLELILSGHVRGRCGPQPMPSKSIDGAPPGQVENKYALVVGIGSYKNGIQPLQYASQDAVNFYNYLVSPTGGNFEQENVVLLRDQYAARASVIQGLNRIKAQSKEGDLVVIYLSSHGTPPDKFGGVHFVTYDSEVKPRHRIWETSITSDDLSEFIQNVKAKRLIVVMDACYSNGAYSQIAGFLPSGSKSLGIEEDEGHGRSKGYMAKRLLGAKDIIIDEPSYISPTTNSNSSQGWGKVLISASDAGERSWESDTLRSSIFTYYFLEGLQSNKGSIKEAFDYSRPRVSQRVKQEKGIDIQQHPQLTPSRSEWNMSLAANEN